MKRLETWYPLLLAAFPVLGIAARNPGAYELGDLFLILAVAVGAATIGLAAATILLRRLGVRVPAFATALGVLLFFFYVPLREWIDPLVLGTPLDHGGRVAAVLVVVIGGVAVALVRKPERLEAATRILSVMGLVLVGWTGAQVALQQFRESGVMSASALAQELARPVPGDSQPEKPLRDIYLIILDSYASRPVLQELFQFDNRPFEDSLRALGFTIPEVTRSNYDFTEVSVPSILNFAYVTQLEEEVGNSTDRTLSRSLVRENRLARFLKARGYNYVIIPAGWSPTSDSPDADRVMRITTGRALTDALDRTELRQTLEQVTLLGRLMPSAPARGDDWVLWGFDSLTTVADDPAATFTLAHFMLPHRPFRFDAECRVRPRPSWMLSREDATYDAAYIGQVKCANARVLETVTTILNRSAVPPLIVIQADHGSRKLSADLRQNPDGLRSFAWERFGAFGAYHLPGGGGRGLGDTVSAVNVFRHVLSYYFGADLPPEPDHAYFIAADGTYQFTQADAALAPAPDTSHIRTTSRGGER